MKRIFLMIILGTAIVCSASLFADDQDEGGLKKISHLSLGCCLIENGQDFGLGVDLTSPYFLGGGMLRHA